MRIHNGVADTLPLTHVSGNQYSFTTDSYSTYALAYSKEQGSSSGTEEPGSSSSGTEEPGSSSSGTEEPGSSSGSSTEPSQSEGTSSGDKDTSKTPDTSDAGASTMLVLMLAGASCVLLGTLAVLQKKRGTKEL